MTKTPSWTLRDRLRKARETAGLTQAELSQRIGIPPGTLASYEAANSRPKRPVLVCWAAECGVPFDWLVNGAAAGGLPSIDGPHDDASTLRTADAAAEAVHVLAHATHGSAGGLTTPATAYTLAAVLAEGAYAESQVARQVLAYLEGQHSARLLRFAPGADPATTMTRLRAAVTRVMDASRDLGAAWDALQDAVTWIGLREQEADHGK